VCVGVCKHIDSMPQLFSLCTSLSIIPSLMTVIRLFPLINRFLIERAFASVHTMADVYVCVWVCVHYCQ